MATMVIRTAATSLGSMAIRDVLVDKLVEMTGASPHMLFAVRFVPDCYEDAQAGEIEQQTFHSKREGQTATIEDGELRIVDWPSDNAIEIPDLESRIIVNGICDALRGEAVSMTESQRQYAFRALTTLAQELV